MRAIMIFKQCGENTFKQNYFIAILDQAIWF